jgi:sugar lactone lactonase YvrE
MFNHFPLVDRWAKSAHRPTSDLALIDARVDHAEDLAFSEGAMWAGGEAGQIYRGSIGAPLAEIALVAGQPLGIACDGFGGVLACCVAPASVTRVSSAGDIRRICGPEACGGLIAPNFGAFLPNGTFVFSDSGQFGANNGRLIGVNGEGAQVLDSSTARFPNGIALSSDGKLLYVVESSLPGVSALAISDDGDLSSREVVCVLPGTVPDGIAVDARGRLLVSCWTPDAIILISDEQPTLLFADALRQQLITPTNLAFVPGTDQVVCVNHGHTFMTTFQHDARGVEPLVPGAAWLDESAADRFSEAR